MSEARDTVVGILLMRCGAYLLGVDPASVRSIRPAEERDEMLLDIGTFLHSSATTDAFKARVIELEDAIGWSMRIDHAIGARSFGLADIVPLPPFFTQHEAPAWWIGTAEHDGEMVLLVDLARLARAAEVSA